MIWKTTNSFKETSKRLNPLRFLLFLAFFSIGLSNGLNAQCNSQNVTLTNFYFGDANGNELDPYDDQYQIGDIVNGYIYGTFGGTSTNGYSVFLEYNLITTDENGVETSESVTGCLDFDKDNDNVNDYDPNLEANQIPQGVPIQLSNFSWVYGRKLEIRNFYMSWKTNPGSICERGTRNSQCYSSPFGYTVRTPLVAQYTYTQNCDNYVVSFTDVTTGGDPATYEYDWDFGSFGISTEPNPVIDFLSAGDYEVSLKVTYYDTQIEDYIDNTYTETISVFDPGVASISYDSPLCSIEGSASVTHTGITGGYFEASSTDLVINSDTGTVDLSNSIAGTYTITYNYSANGCDYSTDTSITINDPAAPTGDALQSFCAIDTPTV
ncbi:PKD domain-containing protein, partial [Christiangramia crocea]